MSSTLKVDNIYTSDDTPLYENGRKSYRTGEIIEYLTSPCNGAVFNTDRGTFTWPTVTEFQGLTTSYTNASGSVINYRPPPEATKVVYRYRAMLAWNDDHAISHWRLYLDDNEVVDARVGRSGRYPEDKWALEWTFSIGSGNDTNLGMVNEWNANKEIKWRCRDYAAANQRYRLHLTQYWNGGGTDMFSRPLLSIIAIA